MDAFGFGPRFTLHRRGRSSAVSAARLGVFDFTDGVLPPGATLMRFSAATRVDASGALVSEGANVARFDYQGGTLRGLLIEPAATNVVSSSADWTNAYWSRFNMGGTAGTLIEIAGASAAHIVRQTTGGVAYVAGQSVTVSVVASERSGSAKRYLLVSLGSTPTFAGNTLAIFDLASGSVTTSTNTSAVGTIALDNGAWLCWLTVTPVNTSASPLMTTFKLNTSATASNSYAGDGSSGLNIGQVQVETGTVPTSRIVTTTGAATRAADVLRLDWRGAGVADGSVTLRYTFDDLSTQDVATVISSGGATVPTTLARSRIRRVEKI